MSNANFNRMTARQSPLRLTPPEPMPESFIKRFPELREWQAKNLEIFKRNEELLASHIAIAGTTEGG